MSNASVPTGGLLASVRPGNQDGASEGPDRSGPMDGRRKTPAHRTHCWCGAALTKDQLRRGGRTCSRSHARRAVDEQQLRGWGQDARASRGRKHRARLIRAIVADLKPYVRPGGLVDVVTAVKVTIKHRGIGYGRGYAARYQRERAVSKLHTRRFA